jgi:2-C-methyl-D-erythritol 4-phosphate cytidylyltransferase/2-C-methyl-D-erythritol 2,4-cyclodiphosphate synthase
VNLDPSHRRQNEAKPGWAGKAPKGTKLPNAKRAPKTVALIVAAGRGLRAGGEVPKQYQLLDGVAVLERAIGALREAIGVSHAIVVIHRDDVSRYEAIAARVAEQSPGFLLPPAFGGATRQVSVRAGLTALKEMAPDIVLIHDAARPFVSAALIGRATSAALEYGAAVPGIPVTDTIRSLGVANASGAALARDTLRAIQTPQAFAFATICEAHERAAANGLDNFTDDGGVAEWAGLDVHVFEGDARNSKLSVASDLERATRNVAPILETRSGLGYDVHAFGEGGFVMLGGMRLAHDRGIIAHSDGDVLLHALTDAVLGALGDGDIGMHFPSSDARWRDAASSVFLAAAVARASRRGGRILLLDATVVCESPRLGPHRDAIRARIAEIACIGVSRVSIKATTSERLGFTGRSEGIAAQAIATIELPRRDSDDYV